jgi:hypothetical protein
MIEQIARNLAARAAENKHTPYLNLAWLCKNCLPCGVNESDGVLIHLAAINILKAQGIENAKRKPLSILSKEQRRVMRVRAKELASIMAAYLKMPIAVTRDPIKTKGSRTYLQIAVKSSNYVTLYLYPTFEYLAEWAALDEANRLYYGRLWAQNFRDQNFQFSDAALMENLETTKAKLECLI